MVLERLELSVKVAGLRNRGEWLCLTSRLRAPNPSDSDWAEAWAFLFDRVESRYLAPIRHILSMGRNQGEGFAATALQCMLMEFLQSSYAGVVYVQRRVGQTTPDPGTYFSSSEVIENFLCQEEFATQFTGKKRKRFYPGVRCKLLHETKTSSQWLIRTHNPANRHLIVEEQGTSLVLYRDALQDALERFLARYKSEVCEGNNAERRQALLYRLDALFDVAESVSPVES